MDDDGPWEEMDPRESINQLILTAFMIFCSGFIIGYMARGVVQWMMLS